MAPRRLPLLVLALAAGCTTVVVDGFHCRPALSMKASSSNKKAAASKTTTPAARPQKPPAVRMPPPPLAGANSKPSPAAVESSAPLDISSAHDHSTCSSSSGSSSPFHCVIEDELGRPRTEARPQGDGRSWHASLQLPSAQQILADASRLRSVSKDMLQDALHYLEYVSLFGKGSGKSSSSSQSKDEPEQGEEDVHSLLDGTWRLAFNSGGAFPFKGARRDRWGYLKDDVEVRIDTSPSAAATILVEAFAKRFEGTLAPLPGARSPNTLALDFSRVQLLGGRGANGAATHAATLKATATTPMLAPGELKLVNAILRPGARLHLISVAASHLALRFTPAATTATTATVGAHTAAQEQELGAGAAASSLLVFERTAAAPPKRPAAAASASAAAGAKKGVAARAAAAVKKAVAAVGDGKKQPQQPQAPKPRFKKPLKGTPSNPYASFFEYLEEECVPLYLVLAFPTFMKHMPHIAHAARFKLLLLQELWVELSARLPFLPHH